MTLYKHKMMRLEVVGALKITGGVVFYSVRNLKLGVFLSCLMSLAISSVWAESDRASKILSKYEKTGETVDCLRLSMVRETNPIDDDMILFEVRGGAMFLNETNSRCSGLRFERRFSYSVSMSQICRGDIIHVLDSTGSRRGACSLGEFQALMEKVDKDTTE